MNYLDELLTLYPGRDWHTQRYFLTHLSGLSPGLETDALLEFLWQQTASERPELRHMARRQLGRVLPGCLRQAYGLEEGKLGIWTAYAQSPGKIAPGTKGGGAEAIDSETHQRLLAAGWHRLSPLLGRALALLGSGSHRVRLAASLVAGRIQTRTGMGALVRGIKGADGKVSFWHAAAMADLGAAEVQPRLLEVARELGGRAPDLAMLLADVPAKEAADALGALERGADAFAATGVALALASDAGSVARHLLERLVKRNEGWVTAFALDALSACPEASDLALAQRVYDRESKEFLRVQAVKVAGALPGNDAVNFLLHTLKNGEPRVQAAALEALARKRVDAQRLVADATALLSSPLLKLRVNAMLVLAKRDPGAVLDSLDALVGSDETVQRVEGAFVLGYLRAPGAAQALGDMALSDPRLPVRLQAIKSLAKQEPAEAIPRLVATARSAHARTAGLAARALASLPEDALSQAVPALAEAAGHAANATTRGLLLRAFGIASSRRSQAAAVPAALEAGLADKHEPVVLGSLEGVKCLGGSPLAPVQRLAQSADPRVKYRATVAAFLQGDLSMVEPIDDLLTSADESAVLNGLQALLEIGILLPIAIAAPPFAPLRASLERIASETAVRTFAVEEQPRAPQTAEAAPVKAPATAARFEAVSCNIAVKRPAPRRESPTSRKGGGDSPLARQSVEAGSYLAGLPAGPAAWREWFATYRALVAAAAVLMIPVVMTMFRWQTTAAAGPGAPLPAGAMKALDVKGKVERGLPGKGLSALPLRGQVQPGERVTTGKGAQLMLSDGKGNAVILGENSGILLGVPAKEATTPAACPFLIQEPEGDVLLDFRKSKGVEAIIGAEHLGLEKATARVVVGAGTGSVSLVAGEARLFRAGAAGRSMSPGQTLELKP